MKMNYLKYSNFDFGIATKRKENNEKCVFSVHLKWQYSKILESKRKREKRRTFVYFIFEKKKKIFQKRVY